MSNYLFLIYKVGDASNGIKDGMPICYIDPDDYSDIDDYGKTISYHMKTVFLITKLHKNKLPIIKKNLIETENGSKRKFKINFKKLGLKIGNSNLDSQLRSKNKVEIVDCQNIDDSILFDKLDKINNIKYDFNAISSGSYTIGVSGDYATWSLAFSDIIDLTGDLKLTQVSEITESLDLTTTVTLNGHNFNITSADKHYGDFNSGYITNLSGNTSWGFRFENEGPGNINVSDLYFKRTGTPSIDVASIVLVSTAVSYTLNIYNIIQNGNGKRSGLLRNISASPIVNLYNCAIDDVITTPVIYLSQHNAGSKFENITIFNSGTAIDNGNFVTTFNNIVMFNCGTNVTRPTNGTSNNSATDKASVGFITNNNPKVSLTILDEFKSITLTDGNVFLEPIKNSNIDGGGINSVIANHLKYLNNTDIIVDNVDIGAKGVKGGATSYLYKL